jgi:hypothetical protein
MTHFIRSVSTPAAERQCPNPDFQDLKDFQDFCQSSRRVESSGSLTAEQKSWKSFNPENQGSDNLIKINEITLDLGFKQLYYSLE